MTVGSEVIVKSTNKLLKVIDITTSRQDSYHDEIYMDYNKSIYSYDDVSDNNNVFGDAYTSFDNISNRLGKAYKQYSDYIKTTYKLSDNKDYSISELITDKNEIRDYKIKNVIDGTL